MNYVFGLSADAPYLFLQVATLFLADKLFLSYLAINKCVPGIATRNKKMFGPPLISMANFSKITKKI